VTSVQKFWRVPECPPCGKFSEIRFSAASPTSSPASTPTSREVRRHARTLRPAPGEPIRRRAPGPCLTPNSLGSGGGSRGASWFGGRELNFYSADRRDFFFSIASTCKGIRMCWKRRQTRVVRTPSIPMELIHIHSGVCMVGVCHCTRWHARAECMGDITCLHAFPVMSILAHAWRPEGA